MQFDVDQWHKSVHRIYNSEPGYAEYRGKCGKYKGRIIPICTPVNDRVYVLVIGKNHSDFDPANEGNADRIAESYSLSAPKSPEEHSLLHHNHEFAVRWRCIGREVGLEVSDEWISTNRCAVQTGPKKRMFLELKRQLWFKSTERQMDIMVYDLIQQKTI